MGNFSIHIFSQIDHVHVSVHIQKIFFFNSCLLLAFMSNPSFILPIQTNAALKQPKSFQGASLLTRPQTITPPGNSVLAQQKANMVTATQIQNKVPVTQTVRPPLSQLGPASSKVLLQTSKPAASQAANASRIKGGASATVTAALAAHAQKLDTNSLAASHKEKRKFEALKWVDLSLFFKCVIVPCWA